MTEEWCCEKLANLKIKENRLNTLEEIRTQLTVSTNLEEIVTNRLLSAPELYECLDEERNEYDVASDILTICMGNLSLNQELPRILLRALQHKRARILALNAIVKELQRHGDARAVNDQLEISAELLKHVFEALSDDASEVGVPALNILKYTLSPKVDDQMVLQSLLGMLNANEVVKCRVYELAVHLSKISASHLKQMEVILDQAISELDNDDVLLQVNILEIFVSLAEQNHGLVYLEKRQLFEVISRKVETLEQHPLDRLLIPGIMKFFGKVACIQPQKIITGYPNMIHCLFDCLYSGDTSLLPASFDTMANLAQTPQGKLLLDANYAEPLKTIFETFASHLRNLNSDLKNRAFYTLEIIFKVESATVSNEISALLHKWFTYLASGSSMQFLMDFCRNPFPDIKVACLNFIRTLCRYKWGIAALKSTGGFVEYLLDRKNEFDKEAKFAKFEVIQLLADSSEFDVQTNLQLRTYVNEGPYYVQVAMEIAVEGN